MNLSFHRSSSCLIVKMSGELDLSSASVFKERVDEELRKTGAANLILNLQGLDFVDSTGLGAILGRHRQITLGGGKMILTSVPPKVQSMLEMAGLFSVLQCERTDKDALQVIESPFQGGAPR
ncbi:MAG TPA: anti-sigma factor antagonist [Firmicutes bacterium]|nr:anti-sigma factor antagonist [Candidatus Fermentithermobacillaceae bacterium]